MLRTEIGYCVLRTEIGYCVLRTEIGYCVLRTEIGYCVLRTEIGYCMLRTRVALRAPQEGVLGDRGAVDVGEVRRDLSGRQALAIQAEPTSSTHPADAGASSPT